MFLTIAFYEQLTLSRFVRNFLNIGNLGTTTSKYSGRREIKQTLAACNGSAADLVHRFIQLMQLEVPFALSRRRPGSTFAVGTGFRRCSGFDMSDDASLPDESCE